MDQVSIYTNISHNKTLQNLPKIGFLVWKQTIWQPWCKYNYVNISLVQTSLRNVQICAIPTLTVLPKTQISSKYWNIKTIIYFHKLK
jgi:hypothetical protein